MGLSRLLSGRCRALDSVWGSFVLLATTFPITAVAADAELTASIEPLVIEMSAQGANFASVQLVYDTHERGEQRETPFRLYAVGTDAGDQKARALAAYSLADRGWTQELAQPLDSSIKLLQLVQSRPSAQLLVYAGDTLSALETSSRAFQPLMKLSSIYRASAVELDAEIEFARELTGDGFDDLLVPDFEGWWFSAATADGNYAEPQLFGPSR